MKRDLRTQRAIIRHKVRVLAGELLLQQHAGRIEFPPELQAFYELQINRLCAALRLGEAISPLQRGSR